MDKVLKRIEKEQKDNLTPDEYFYTQPIANNMYEWHFTILGSKDTAFDKGIYHGYFALPTSYPMNPPDVYFMTENGRFAINQKICLNITGYHKEAWTPAWSLRTMVQAICAYMLVNEHGVGAIFDDETTRRKYAAASRSFKCHHCGSIDKIEKHIIDNRKKSSVTDFIPTVPTNIIDNKEQKENLSKRETEIVNQKKKEQPREKTAKAKRVKTK